MRVARRAPKRRVRQGHFIAARRRKSLHISKSLVLFAPNHWFYNAWSPNLRSKTAIRTSSTRHFVDPSIGCAALGVGPGALLDDLRTFGLFFESLCIRDLRVYAEALKGTVSHYRDANGLEADAVVHLRDGSWAAVEVKLASSQAIDEGARHLRKLSDKIDTDRMGPPSFLMVLTATQYAYRREDGVYVVPLGCLER